MSYFKMIFAKTLIITIVFIFLFSFFGCKKIKSYRDISEITYDELLEKKGNYIVIVYSTVCMYCEKLESTVVEYVKEKKLPLYVLCIDKVENQNLKAENDEYDDFLGTKDLSKIKVSMEPALIEVSENQVVKVISSKYTNRPYTDIKNYLSTTKE